MKQAIQLEIPFDGQVLSTPAAAAAATPSPVKSISPDAAELRALAVVRRAAAAVRAAAPTLVLFARAVACVAFSFALMFLAALIGG